jgi:adenylosuccinate lyase
MKASFRRFVCNLVVLNMILLPYAAHTQAALIGTEQAVARVQAQAGRDKLHSFVARADVQNQLAGLGLSAAAAGERVNALTDDEVQQLAGKIDALPAGADGGAVAVLLIVILVLLLFFMLDSKRH